ncbi:DNA methyltransferase, partial [Streptomyces sp. 4F]
RQVFVVEAPGAAGPPLLLATSRPPLFGPARVRPLYRRPGGTEPNLAPGLLDHLGARLGRRPEPLDVLAWAVATVREGSRVPLTADPAL